MPNSSVVKVLFRAPQRYPSGVGTTDKNHPLNKLGFPSPMQWHEKFSDFDSGDFASGWAVNGTGTPASAEVAGDGGLIKIITTTGSSDETAITPKTAATAAFTFDVARKFYFETRFYTDATTTISQIYAGVIGASTVGSTFADGFMFNKPAGSNIWSFLTKATSGSGTSTNTLSNATPGTTKTFLTNTYGQNWVNSLNGTTLITYGFAYEGQTVSIGGTAYYIFKTYQDANDGTGLRIVDVLVAATNFPANTVNLEPVVGFANSTGVARNMVIDYIFVAKERFTS